ncbi:alpha-L-fucosidase [Marinoscillum furvescens]|uniref:alpha-L-fucosidase n=1 Tax=Marinoscillum furvescens DSM 4134 TaxID=1122208 RepID=A0A3D9L153_MARFU|nr:alpha-L-fucosidase [Marinoscillum furvescens]RED96550.1 alpha-L-fucosidase [Marinoscillum furvescens DSM 4134]
MNPFKSLYSILLLTFLFGACDQADPLKARRFSFVLPTDANLLSILENTPDGLETEVYKTDEHTFLLVDAPSDYDLSRLRKAFSGNSEIQDLLKSPLERIYKLEQQANYSAQNGQLITREQQDSKRYVLTLEIVNDLNLLKMYKHVHSMGMAWPEITENMKTVGIRDMEIYLDGYRAFLVMDTKPDFEWEDEGEQWGTLPREKEWQEYVAKFQKVDPQSKAAEKWAAMKRITAYQASWESLSNYEIPQWMKDSKFGIFIHWGPNSVPEMHTDWYSRWMYLDSGRVDHMTGEKTSDTPHPAHVFHKENFGDPKKFGFKDLIPMWTMEKFDPKEWVSIFKQSGAQYVVPVAEHHDGFALYESSITPYHAVAMGPKTDVLKALTDEIKKQGLICGVSSHLAFNWNFYTQKPHFDTWDPQYADLYAPRHEPYSPASEEWLAETWWPRTKEIIDNYQPDILWFDFYLDRPEFAPYHKKLAAYYYNSGLKRNQTVVLQTKNLRYQSYREGTHMLDLERSKMDSLRSEYWQTDTSIGKNSWFYTKNWIPKAPGDLIADLMDIVSKNGCLLLNIGPRKDGIIPDDQKETLLAIGEWLKVNGEAVYGSSYWRTFGEGPTETATGHLSEDKNSGFTQEDIRFTKNNGFLYATVLAPPTRDITIRSLSTDQLSIQSIELLGYDGSITYQQNADGLSIKRPKSTQLQHAWVFKITPSK